MSSAALPPIGGTVVKISAVIPDALSAVLEQRARAEDRSMSAEIRRALTEYLAAEPTPVKEQPAQEGRNASVSCRF
jgi:plasmid stability protein